MAGSGPIPDKALGLYYTSKKINKRFNCTMTKVHLIICHLKFNIRKRIQRFPHSETAKYVDQKLSLTFKLSKKMVREAAKKFLH